MDKKIIKFDDTEIEKYKFHQHKSPISIDNIVMNKIVVPITSHMVKRILNIFLAIKMLNK